MRQLLTILVFLLSVANVRGAETVLPVGAAPPALALPHFPSRVHAFVWRNWNLVPTDRVARVLGTDAPAVREIADSMGLPPEEPIPAAYGSRLYLSIIRRNWHLLPYDQLLTLLDWTPERLSEALREDDFLYIKLGSLKPRCEPLVYQKPTESQRARAAQIRALVEREFGKALVQPAEKPLSFVMEFTAPIEHPRPAPPTDSVRFLYSYFAVFGDPLADPSLDPYPDALLQRYADLGVNGVWLHVVLRQLAPPTADFPEFGRGAEQRLAALRTVGSSRVDLQACKLEYSIVSPK